ncbi:DNA adenine methylase [Pectobacterium brasiliense]|uniref:site-specific DNA-methyltransferase (adenine-specific) n=1 Tax=Pectobacterium brasiliense TaxID=180957 RepID=A0A7T0N102_9GAMM|nr:MULTISPECIES: DNA adenine methylase [Pectobacterium]MBN3045767.1 DNA adenine methylase [Pectobacterium brasiliense]MBN3076142.1 DNA adenine methylase [Pectobacterium brasiliense]MBN3086535.1 DNA adenine methylase [Pectobacterium brasiliense]MBN3090632.1 DNA adenine methylase [Pectobacterium brasiliense]MBN3107505.1 DNA adenine methylase [Pectobacterium brasiliense]
MKKSSYSTPLRYPGGKGKFAYYLKRLIEANGLNDGHYVEPYAGGAGVALDLLFNEFVSRIHINDLDPAVYSFWWAAVNHTEELCSAISKIPVTIEQWEIQKKIINNIDNNSLVDVALATFFLNRTNRSGILKAGVIGGKNQSGKWKLDVRFNKPDLISRIQMIGAFGSRINIHNYDAIALMDNVVKTLPKNTLLYLDPPYYHKGSGLYRNFYNHEDHVAICKKLDEVKHPWIVSYDNAEEIKEIYSAYRQEEYFLNYTAQEKRKGSEVMIFGPGVVIPSKGLKK